MDSGGHRSQIVYCLGGPRLPPHKDHSLHRDKGALEGDPHQIREQD